MIALILKIWNWIIKTYKLVKDSIGFVVQMIALIGVISTFLSVKGCIRNKEDKNNFVNILTSKIDTFKTVTGQNAIEINNWKIKYKSLERVNSEITQENNVYLNELSEAKETIKDLKLREKDVKNYIKNELVSKDSIRTELVFLEGDNIEIKPIEKKHIKINFVQRKEFLDVTYIYNANVSTVISRYPELKLNGKKHFPNWGWIWGWDYKTTSTINDPNANIENIVSIEFDK